MPVISSWLNKKMGSAAVKIESHLQFNEQILVQDHLVVFFGPATLNNFRVFAEVAKDFIQQDDIEFAHVDTQTYPKRELDFLRLFTYEEEGWQLRIYRRKSKTDFKDFAPTDEFAFDRVRAFVIHATFVGPTPFANRELTTESARKIFVYNVPVLILFRNQSDEESRPVEKQLVNAKVEYDILVVTANINTQMS